MAYRLKLQEPIAEGVRRVGLEQIEIAEAKLASDDDVPAAIHDARRCLKRLRALLHLVRPGLDETVYRREAEHVSAIGKLLSRERDRHVMQQTLARLEKHPGALPKAASARLRKLVGESGEADVARSGHDERRPALARLAQARKLFSGKAIGEIELDHLVDGLGAAYRKARKAFRKAYDKPSDESFHAWRKAAQLHWRHMLLLSHGWPEALLARAGEAKEVSRLLGEDHDYSVLVAFAQAQGQAGPALRPDDVSSLAALCRARQEELRTWAKPRGDRLFAERAEDLKERIADYWFSAQCLSGMSVAPEQKARTPAPAGKVKRVRRPRRGGPRGRG
jgi:CHAD domain-containing protein